MAEHNIERRDLRELPEIRDGSGQGNRMVGYIAKFNSPTNLDMFGRGQVIESIAPGAFARTLRENADIRALVNHDASRPLGRTRNGTLRLSEDATGLRFEVDLPDTHYAQDAKALVRRGDVSGCSFGFFIPEGGDKWQAQGGATYRTLIDVDLYEVSPVVTFPAYEATEVSVRNRRDAAPTWRSAAARRALILLDLG